MKGIRATEVRNYIRVRGETGMIDCIEQLYERMSAIDQQISELAQLQLQIIKALDQVTTGAGNMRNQIEKMQGRDEDDDDLPPATGH